MEQNLTIPVQVFYKKLVLCVQTLAEARTIKEEHLFLLIKDFGHELFDVQDELSYEELAEQINAKGRAIIPNALLLEEFVTILQGITRHKYEGERLLVRDIRERFISMVKQIISDLELREKRNPTAMRRIYLLYKLERSLTLADRINYLIDLRKPKKAQQLFAKFHVLYQSLVHQLPEKDAELLDKNYTHIAHRLRHLPADLHN